MTVIADRYSFGIIFKVLLHWVERVMNNWLDYDNYSLVTCVSMIKGNGFISEQLWIALRKEIISESDSRMNSSKE